MKYKGYEIKLNLKNKTVRFLIYSLLFDSDIYLLKIVNGTTLQKSEVL